MSKPLFPCLSPSLFLIKPLEFCLLLVWLLAAGIFVSSGVVFSGVALNGNKVSIEFKNSDQSSLRALADELADSELFQDVVQFTNDTFKLDKSLRVVVGADDGPAYDPETAEIQIPYEFVTQVRERFADIGHSDEEIVDATADALMHTYFHELGHALIDQYEIPVVGKEEDAVDALASVILLEYYEHGAEMAMSAATLFELEGEDRGEPTDEDFWGEHSLDEQRAYSTMCHVYGSDPEQFGDLIDQPGFSEDRAERCEYDYAKLVDDWHSLLQPLLR